MTDNTGSGHDSHAEEWTRRTVAEMPDALVIADAEGLVRVWNAGAERIFGFTEAEALGESLDIIIPENQRKAHWDGYYNTMRTGETRYGAGDLLAVPARHRDGRRLSIQFTVTPLHEGDKMVAIAAVLRDVTTEFEKTKKLRRELAEARSAAAKT